MMLTPDGVGQSVRNNVQLIVNHVGLLLAVDPLSNDGYKILCGGYGELEWDYVLSTYGNFRGKYEFCIKPVQQGRIQGISSGTAVCVYEVEENIPRIHMIERFSKEDESYLLRRHMVSFTLMSAFMFCKAAECKVVHIVEPIPELVQYYESFGLRMEQCGYAMFAVIDELQDIFPKFA